jgi:hypothetical protein
MQNGAQPTYFREPHIICQKAASGSRAAHYMSKSRKWLASRGLATPDIGYRIIVQ